MARRISIGGDTDCCYSACCGLRPGVSSSFSMLKNLLAHPLTRGIDLDDPKTTTLRREIIRSKPFLRRIYNEWYRWIADQIPTGAGGVLELGSGAGFFDELV